MVVNEEFLTLWTKFMHKQQSKPGNNSSHRLLSPGAPFERKNERRWNVTCLSAYELVAVFCKEDYLLILESRFQFFHA